MLKFGKEVKEALERLPSEETITKLLENLPRIEAILNHPNIERLARLSTLADAFENGRFDHLQSLAPLLAQMPKNDTLVDIANMKPYLANLPKPEDLKELVGLLRDVKGFMGALRGV